MDHEGEPGFLSFHAGQTVYVWNESNCHVADLGVAGDNGFSFASMHVLSFQRRRVQ
jgi:hypothetical protein